MPGLHSWGHGHAESDNPDLKALNDKGFKHVSEQSEKELQDKATNSDPPYRGFSVDHEEKSNIAVILAI